MITGHQVGKECFSCTQAFFFSNQPRPSPNFFSLSHTDDTFLMERKNRASRGERGRASPVLRQLSGEGAAHIPLFSPLECEKRGANCLSGPFAVNAAFQ